MSPRKNIINSIIRKAHLGLIAIALIAPFILTNKARAQDYIEGGIGVTCSLDVAGSASCNVSFVEGAKDGWDSHDIAYYEMPYPTDSYVKAVGSIEGRAAEGIAFPPIPKVTGSSGGASFSCSFVVKEGKIVTLDHAQYSFSALESMPADCKVYVNGVDLSESTSIPGGEISGVFTGGEYSIGGIDISVEYVGTGGNGEDPNEPNTPEPNLPYLNPALGILNIDNILSRTSKITNVQLILEEGASEGVGSEDTLYTRYTGIPAPAILSKVDNKYITVDKRAPSSSSPFFLEQVFFSDLGYANMPYTQTNTLVLSFPENEDEGTNNKFGDRILTFQEYIPDANEPNIPDPNASMSNFPDPNAETYPIYLIRELIEDGNGLGVVFLPDLPKKRFAGTWHYFVFRTDAPSKELAMADFDRDGRVDVNDCNALEGAMGHTGNSVYDIASCDPNAADPNDPNSPLLYIGIRPDGIVDETDVRAIYQLMESDTKRREDINRREESDELKLTESSCHPCKSRDP